jgi:pimeloyl-ACP methyl ester carboxylesterase
MMRKSPTSWLAACVLIGLLRRAYGADDFDWDSIEPSRKLEYHPCYEEFQCARLVVPLDWQDESNPHTVAIAIAKLPATVSDDDPSFGGSILTNPGGPGGSGIGFVKSYARKLRDVVDGYRHYEILGFDPRGVAHTTPKADCFDDYFLREADMLRERDIGTADVSVDALRRQYARHLGFGNLCKESAVNGSILPYITTASVARDMVEMVDKIDELRKASSSKTRLDGDSSQRPMARDSGDDTPRIQYMGYSYGSVLGNTFASMFPGRVGRLIIDGICDADDYVEGVS